MYCAIAKTYKVCISQTATLTSAASSCGGYEYITAFVATPNNPCLSTELAIMTQGELGQSTASPFHLTVAEGAIIAASILGVWAIGYSIKSIKRAIGDHSPE